MKPRAWSISVAVGVLAGVVAATFWGESRRELLREEIAAARGPGNMSAIAIQPAVASAVLAGASLQEEQQAIARLRRDMELIRQRVDARARTRVAAQNDGRVGQPAGERSITQEMLPPEFWRDRGRSTASDTVETALWAVAGGDLSTLAALLEFEPASRSKAMTLLQGLPPSVRAQYSTPEQLVALLGASDVPLGEALISEQASENQEQALRRVEIFTPGAAARRATVRLRREGATWRIVVTEKSIDYYAGILRGRPRP